MPWGVPYGFGDTGGTVHTGTATGQGLSASTATGILVLYAEGEGQGLSSSEAYEGQVYIATGLGEGTGPSVATGFAVFVVSGGGQGTGSSSAVPTIVFVATGTGQGLGSSLAIGTASYLYVTPLEVASSMSASVRSTTPTTPDPRSEFIRLDGTTVRGLLHVDHDVPLGVGAQVLHADLILYKADAWPSSGVVTVSPIDADWDAETVTWNTQPAVRTGTTAPVASGGAAGDEVSIDVTDIIKASIALADTAGTPWRGLRLSVDTSGEKKLYSSYAAPTLRPRLTLETSRPPLAPFELQPNAGRAVSETKPELVARFADPDLEDTLSAVRVQIATVDTFTTTVYDSGKIASSTPRFDLASPPAGAPATPTLSTATTYYWREKVWDNHGLESDWSEVGSFIAATKSALTLTSPSGSSITSPVPAIAWTFSGQEQVEILLEKREGGIWVEHWTVPKHVSATTSFSVPNDYALREGVDYRVTVRGWDSVFREDMPGDRAFSEDSQEFTLAGVSV